MKISERAVDLLKELILSGRIDEHLAWYGWEEEHKNEVVNLANSVCEVCRDVNCPGHDPMNRRRYMSCDKCDRDWEFVAVYGTKGHYCKHHSPEGLGWERYISSKEDYDKSIKDWRGK